MGNKVSPVVSGIIIAIVVVVAVFFGYRATAGSGERVTTPQSMGQLMGGDIRVHSEIGVGSSFTVRLPAETVAQVEPSLAPEVSS